MDIDCNKYIGKYFKRITNDNTHHCVLKIDGFDGSYFRVTEYYLTLGYSTKEINQRKNKVFVEKDNFQEITKEEFNTVVACCIEPFVTIFDENEKPYYCRETQVEKLKMSIK